MSRIRRVLFAALCGAVVVALPLAAQEAPAPAPDTSSSTVEGGGDFDIEENLEDILQEQPLGADSYRYDSQGRRDPFRSLVGPARTTGVGERPAGYPGFLVDEIALAGVVRTRQSLVALIAGPDNKGHLLRVGDKVFDGEVVRITQDSIVFRQEVNDPTRIERFREVVKELSPQSVKK
jgi:Tfp pilus assembly protein PilP